MNREKVHLRRQSIWIITAVVCHIVDSSAEILKVLNRSTESEGHAAWIPACFFSSYR